MYSTTLFIPLTHRSLAFCRYGACVWCNWFLFIKGSLMREELVSFQDRLYLHVRVSLSNPNLILALQKLQMREVWMRGSLSECSLLCLIKTLEFPINWDGKWTYTYWNIWFWVLYKFMHTTCTVFRINISSESSALIFTTTVFETFQILSGCSLPRWRLTGLYLEKQSSCRISVEEIMSCSSSYQRRSVS